MAKQDKKTHIIESALEVLKEVGLEGLTMRRVAAHMGMSLGNLQYHFKDKPALSSGIARYYFGACIDLLGAYESPAGMEKPEAQLHGLILFYLDHVDHISDMCRVFREFWSLSTRDAALRQQLTNYYTIMGEKLAEKLQPVFPTPESAKPAVTLLLPYFEGFSITFDAVPMKKAAVAQMLTDLCLSLRSKSGN